METEILSDLEEGEILELDVSSPNNIEKDSQLLEVQNISFRQKTFNEKFPKSVDLINMPVFELQGYFNKKLRKRLKLADDNLNLIDSDKTQNYFINLTSSDDECDSGEARSSFFNDCKHLHEWIRGKDKKKRLYTRSTNGTVEELMSRIDRVVSKKSCCDHKRRRSKENKYNKDKYEKKSCFCGHTTQEINVGHKSVSKTLKHGRHKICSHHSASDRYEREVSSRKHYVGYKKKKIKNEYHYNEYCSEGKSKRIKLNFANKNIRDFDEVRKNLLEKLKQKEQMKEDSNDQNIITNSGLDNLNEENACVSIKSNKIGEKFDQNVEKCPLENVSSESPNENIHVDAGGDDELDLVQLRLIALASNKKKKNVESSLQNSEKLIDNANSFNSLETKPEENNCVNREDEDETDIDRNELLLRAEALKTALLKKHQKRINKLKEKKLHQLESSNDNDLQNLDELVPLKPNEESKKSNEINEVPRENYLGCDAILKSNDVEEKKTFLNLDDSKNNSQYGNETEKNENIVSESNLKASTFTPKTTKSTNMAFPSKVKSLPKIPKPEMQRIIVHLGSDDSSEDDIVVPEKNNQFLLPSSTENVRNADTAPASNQIDESLKAMYERKVIRLLEEAKKKVKEELERAKSNPVSTPEAVYKHLPPSQRLEYIMLKKKIAEREKLKMLRKENNENFFSWSTKKATSDFERKKISEKNSPGRCRTGSITSTTLPVKDACLVSSTNSVFSKSVNCANLTKNSKTNSSDASPSKFTTSMSLYPSTISSAGPTGIKTSAPELNSSKVLNKKYVVSPCSASKVVIPSQSTSFRSKSTQVLISKLKLLLKKIKIEKTIEENYKKEILRLKTQLSLAERKKHEQCCKIKKLADESAKIYKIVQNITRSVSLSPRLIKSKLEKTKVESDGKTKTCDLKTNEEIQKDECAGVKETKLVDENNKGTKDNGHSCDQESNNATKVENIIEKELSPEITGNNSSNECEKDQNLAEKESAESNLKLPSASYNLVQYNSPLEVFAKGSDKTERVNPNVIMCQFDLTGVCKDEECKYQHFRA